jgi:hypothetical protein
MAIEPQNNYAWLGFPGRDDKLLARNSAFGFIVVNTKGAFSWPFAAYPELPARGIARGSAFARVHSITSSAVARSDGAMVMSRA